MQPFLMKMHLYLVLCFGIIVDHLAAKNQGPEFALNCRERIRNVEQIAIFWSLVLTSSTRFRIWTFNVVIS